MMRQSSHSSSLSGSTAAAASPKGRLSFFKKTKFSIRDDTGSSDKIYEAPPNDKIVSSPFALPELEITRSIGNLPSPDSFVGATHDVEFLHLKENIRRLRKAPPGPDPKKVDAVWEVYKKLRDESLQLCRSLLQKSQSSGRNASLESNIGPLDTRSSHSGSITETSLPFHVNDQWLGAIHEYKALQEGMLENLRTSLLATYKAYEPDATDRQLEAFLADKVHRKNLIIKWRDTSVHRMKSEKLLFWEQYKIRSLNFDKLKLDLQAVENLFEVADSGEAPNMAIREYVIARNGDAVLEFANAASEIHPILRFRVSSHLLAEASLLFYYIFSPRQQGKDAPLDMIADLPPSPRRDICKDGMEVKVYRMPQIELNQHESLTILLHAAHMHKQKVPREIEFAVFVSIADVCVRYRCTSPIELQVEYQWLPQWTHVTGDEYRDGLLLIGYAFGDQGIFKRMSKTAILNAVDEAEIESKTHWPQAVREKVKAVRAAKLAQIHACCTNAIEEYFRPPLDHTDRRSSVGSLTLTTVPRCPRGSHLCDATNLGWLMLVYNELRVLPNIIKSVDFHDLPKAPRRSLKELVDCLRLMPSAPQVHSGVCDYAPSFRSAISDIYNSVSGLSLRDFGSRRGLSKDNIPFDESYDDVTPEIHELPTVELSEDRAASTSMSNNEAVCLGILSYLDDIEDLNSAAMIDKGFYRVYKRNEAALLKNVMRAERRRTLSMASPDIAGFRESLRSDDAARRPSNLLRVKGGEESKSLVSDNIQSERHNDLYDVSPPCSPISQEEVPMSAEEAHRILWPDDVIQNTAPDPGNGPPVERNEKYLVGDVAHIEDKTIMEEDNKHLRDEKDFALGLGIHKSNPKPPS